MQDSGAGDTDDRVASDDNQCVYIYSCSMHTTSSLDIAAGRREGGEPGVRVKRKKQWRKREMATLMESTLPHQNQ